MNVYLSRERRGDNLDQATLEPLPGHGMGHRFFATLAELTKRSERFFGRIISEPLVHFVLAGFILVAVTSLYDAQSSIYRIDITPEHVAEIANNYALQFGTRPDAQTLEALVQRDIADEIYYREGKALHLDENDEIVRRRVAQKVQFLTQGLAAPQEPTQAQLEAYYASHAARYVTPPRVTFSHIFFSADRGGEASARQRAEAVLVTLPATVTRAPERGDVFPDLFDFSAYNAEQVTRVFGHTPFSAAVFSSPTGRWTGPFRSAYGWHLIYVDSRQNQEHPPLARIRDTVRADFLQDAQEAANRRSFDRMASKFIVIRDDRRQP